MEPPGTTPSEPDEPPTPSDGGRDWSELPLDALVLIFARLGPVEILMGSGLVCHSWLRAAKEAPELWTSLDMANDHRVVEDLHGDLLLKMARVAVDRAKGRLEVFSGKHFVTDELLRHISSSGRSSSLRSLALVSCHEVSNKGFTELVTSSPMLEDLSLELCPNVGGRGVLESAGRACPRLRRFSLRRECFRSSLNYSRRTAEALGIAAAMAGLRSLTLVSSNINNDELAAVVDGCPRLETLCLRDCYKVIADASLRAKCAGIRTLTLPDSTV